MQARLVVAVIRALSCNNASEIVAQGKPLECLPSSHL